MFHFVSHKKVILWMAGWPIILLMYSKNWRGNVCDVHTASVDGAAHSLIWELQGKEIEQLIHHICNLYGLSGCDASLVIGGPLLKLDSLDLPVQVRKEARAVLQNTYHFAQKHTVYDIDFAGPGEDGAFKWVLASYPQDRIQTVIDAFRSECVSIQTIDIVPALVSRLFPLIEGTLSLADGTGAHECFLQGGNVSGYIWTPSASYNSNAFPLDQNLERTPIPIYQQVISRWDLHYPAAWLTALL
jgi:hypothetical protein